MKEYTGHCLFDEPYWLDAVAPGAWSAVEIKRDGVIIGRLPYVLQKKLGISSISTPLYTTWLSPWIRQTGGKSVKDHSNEHQVLEELAKQLPVADRIYIAAAPEFSNLMALHWAGYQLKYGYTHRINLQSNSIDEIWTNFKDSTRRQIRKAEKLTTITTTRNIGDFCSILLKTFSRQGIDMSGAVPALERIDAVMGPRDQRRIFCAEDAAGNIHAAVYVVFDERHVFYVAGGGDPEFRQSAAHSYAMWEAIKFAATRAPIFDFCGSMVPGIEYFVRGFGPEQVPRFMAEKYSRLGRIAMTVKSFLK